MNEFSPKARQMLKTIAVNTHAALVFNKLPLASPVPEACKGEFGLFANKEFAPARQLVKLGFATLVNERVVRITDAGFAHALAHNII